MRTTILILLALFLALPVAACGSGGTGGAGGDTSSNPCIVNPESCMGTCLGQCAAEPFGFADYMLMLWSGPQGVTPPSCPAEAPVPSLGYLDTPPDFVECSPCTCGPSEGACFPPTKMKANSAACPANGAGVMHTPLDTPTVWDGTCISQSPAPSADSLTVSPASLSTNATCSRWGGELTGVQGGKTRSLTCTTFSHTLPDGKCPEGQSCAFGNVEGFSVCIVDFFADVACPPGWPVKHLNYDETELCHCSCSDPVGESCTSTVTVYEDDDCTQPLGSTPVSAGKPAACINLGSGSALRSASATPPIYTAGTCTPTLKKSHPWTLCCLE